MKKKKSDGYPWKFMSVGGSVRVKIETGEDIAHLGELDRKMWTVLSCPTSGLEFDARTLELIDTDHDGRIGVDEVVQAASWLTRVLKDRECIVSEGDGIPFSAFNEADPDGARLLSSARQILRNLGLEKDGITLAETADNTRIFAGTRFNGDGIITPATATDESGKQRIAQIIACEGGVLDRSGAEGVTAEKVEAFYAACADFLAWRERAGGEVFPFGDKTEEALQAVLAVGDKVEDFFVRCHLVAFDPATRPAVDVSVERIAAMEGNLAGADAKLSEEPLAKPVAEGMLPLRRVNPAWQQAVDRVVALALPKGKETLSEAEWRTLVVRFDAYRAWMAAKKGVEVESLGLDTVKEIVKEGGKQRLLDLIAQDKALEAEALSIEEVDKVLRYNKHFFRFLNNYVVFSDFYGMQRKAMFQAGRLYIDQRSTDLCVRVDGPSAEISSLSGMYILYCHCANAGLSRQFNIAAVLTDGDVDGLREGKNAVFYDREGNSYAAKVTSIVDNPISIRQAFWSPYKKVGRWINDRIDQMAEEKNSGVLTDLTKQAEATVDAAASAKPAAAPAAAAGGATASAPAFDIAKFAGIFAAIGMALGFIGQFLASLVTGVRTTPFWQLILLVCGALLAISAPSMFIAWRKLRRRDLGPLLNANGWAVNASSLVNVRFGRTLTSLASYPTLASVDPVARAKAFWGRMGWTLLALVVLGVVALWLLGLLSFVGLESPVPFLRDLLPINRS